MSREAWIRLANLQIAARAANLLVDHFATPEAIFDASLDELGGVAGLTEKQALRLIDPSFIPTEAQLDALSRLDVQVVGRSDEAYPRSLKEIPDPPPVLFTRGALQETDRFAVALVGSRQATPYGLSVTARMAQDLARASLTVVSGGAIGIDTAAHQATLDAGGRTLVVLGCGLDIDYPRENQRLFRQIVEREQGALVTEFPLGSTPEPYRFPMRNRIISGLSMGVVVIEAGVQSGALLTASIAAEQGREVMAVPGNVDRIGSKGTNALIRDGAALVECAQDVMRTLDILTLEAPPNAAPAPAPHALRGLPPEQKRLLECLSLTPRHIDALAAETGLSSSDAGVQLTMLELGGLVRRLPGSCYIRVL